MAFWVVCTNLLKASAKVKRTKRRDILRDAICNFVWKKVLSFRWTSSGNSISFLHSFHFAASRSNIIAWNRLTERNERFFSFNWIPSSTSIQMVSRHHVLWCKVIQQFSHYFFLFRVYQFTISVIRIGWRSKIGMKGALAGVWLIAAIRFTLMNKEIFVVVVWKLQRIKWLWPHVQIASKKKENAKVRDRNDWLHVQLLYSFIKSNQMNVPYRLDLRAYYNMACVHMCRNESAMQFSFGWNDLRQKSVISGKYLQRCARPQHSLH